MTLAQPNLAAGSGHEVRQQVDASRAASTCTTLKLPAPPSVNNLFSNGKGGHTGRFKTPAYKAWIAEASWMVREQMVAEDCNPVMGRTVIMIGVERSSLRSDLDNQAKAILDLLVTTRVIEDDRYVTGLVMAWMPQGARRTPIARVMIMPADPVTLNFHPSPDGATGGWFIDAPEGEEE